MFNKHIIISNDDLQEKFLIFGDISQMAVFDPYILFEGGAKYFRVINNLAS